MRTTRLSAVDEAVRRALREARPSWSGQTVVCALSGGPDSTALLDALVSAAGPFGYAVVAAHLDHRLRPGSADDARSCARLCGRLGVPLRSGSADVAARARRERGGVEQAARHERWAFLRGVMKETGASAVATGHTRDDQAETVLLRLLRGSGRTGLGAMRPAGRGVLRPLLAVSRSDVLEHLRARGLDWSEDPTNADTRLLRNRVRHELLPYLESRFNPALRKTLARTAAVMAGEAELLARLAAELLGRIGRREASHMVLSRAGLAQAPRALARLALRKAIARGGGLRGVGRTHVERLLALAASPHASGRRLALPGGREATARFDELWIGPAEAAWPSFERPLSVPGRVELPDGTWLSARESGGPAASKADGTVLPLPAEPLVVRTRRPGDRVWAAGRERSLKRVLLESRVPAARRARLPLVAAGQRVVWFPGLASGGAEAGGRRFVALRLERPPAREAR